jgi:hypothetical protein
MRRRWLAGVLAACMIGGTTAGGIAATSGNGGVGNGNASSAQYRPPHKCKKGHVRRHGKCVKKHPHKCKNLARMDRQKEAAAHRKHQQKLSQLHGRKRARAARRYQRRERAYHAKHVRAERRCRRHH